MVKYTLRTVYIYNCVQNIHLELCIYTDVTTKFVYIYTYNCIYTQMNTISVDILTYTSFKNFLTRKENKSSHINFSKEVQSSTSKSKF